MIVSRPTRTDIHQEVVWICLEQRKSVRYYGVRKVANTSQAGQESPRSDEPKNVLGQRSFDHRRKCHERHLRTRRAGIHHRKKVQEEIVKQGCWRTSCSCGWSVCRRRRSFGSLSREREVQRCTTTYKIENYSTYSLGRNKDFRRFYFCQSFWNPVIL